MGNLEKTMREIHTSLPEKLDIDATAIKVSNIPEIPSSHLQRLDIEKKVNIPYLSNISGAKLTYDESSDVMFDAMRKGYNMTIMSHNHAYDVISLEKNIDGKAIVYRILTVDMQQASELLHETVALMVSARKMLRDYEFENEMAQEISTEDII